MCFAMNAIINIGHKSVSINPLSDRLQSDTAL